MGQGEGSFLQVDFLSLRDTPSVIRDDSSLTREPGD